jgi:galactokinase
VGMSSSNAFMAGVFLAVAEVNHLAARDEYWHNIGNKIDLAGYLGTIETGQSFGTLEGDGVAGIFGGSEDYTAILGAEPNCISQYAFCPVEFEKSLAIPPDHLFAIAVSGVASRKTDQPAKLAAKLAELWRRGTGRDDPHLAAALGSSLDAVERLQAIVRGANASELGDFTPEALLARLEHFIIESGEIIPDASDALVGGDLRWFGRLVDRSQHAAEELLGNQTAETIYLAKSARQHGAAAASSFGTGFGGSVWALVKTSQADDFLTTWADEYREKFPEHEKSACFFASGVGPAAFRVC